MTDLRELDDELAVEEAHRDWLIREGEQRERDFFDWVLDEESARYDFRAQEREAILDDLAVLLDDLAPYAAYLKTTTWKLRAAYAKRWGLCMRCGERTRRLQAHHRTYERVKHERPSDLVALCESCHRATHRI